MINNLKFVAVVHNVKKDIAAGMTLTFEIKIRG